MKSCGVCKNEQPLENFNKDKSRRDGLNGTCKSCLSAKNAKRYLAAREVRRAKSKEWYALNKEKSALHSKKWAAANREKVAQHQRKSYLKNKETALARSKKWYENNKSRRAESFHANYLKNKPLRHARSRAWATANPEKVAECSRNWSANNKQRKELTTNLWYLANPHIRAASTAKRRAAKMLRTPKWLDASELEAIADLYRQAQMLSESTGVPHHVDHEIPLQGTKASGLHVLANLRVVTASENLAKSNKWGPL